MPRIVTGSFEDFAGASRAVSALMAEGYGHGDISIIALKAPEGDGLRRRGAGEARTVALVIAAIGAMIGSGSAWAWAPPDAGAWLAWAPSVGAAIGAGVGILAGALSDLRSSSTHAEAVSVLVDDGGAARVQSILRTQGARLGRRGLRNREDDGSRPLRVVPFRP